MNGRGAIGTSPVWRYRRLTGSLPLLAAAAALGAGVIAGRSRPAPGLSAPRTAGVGMYHAQEKIVNVPGSEITGKRGGIHNSVTRVCPKPTHIIGGYAQLSYGFNYYGTVGANRDEFVIVRKMQKID